MVTPRHLHTMMYKIFIVVFILTLNSCNKTIEEPKLCSISGKINAKEPLGGFKVELFNIENSISYIIYTEPSGFFEFNNIKAGTYELKVTKEKYYYIWMIVDDNEPNHKDSYIKIKDGEHKNIEVLMGGGEYFWFKKFTILSTHGDPINSLECSYDSKYLSFKLFNETNENLYFNISSSFFFTYDLYKTIKYFESFIPQSGTLKPGEDITIICNVNPEISMLDIQNINNMYFPTIEIGHSQSINLDFIN